MSLEDYRRDMEMCSRCSLCKFIPLERVTDADYTYGCPSVARFGFHAYSGGGRVTMGVALLDGRLEHGPKVTEIAYHCLMCGACDISCKYAMDMEVLEPLGEIRAACVEAGQTAPVFERLVRTLGEESVMVTEPRAGRRLGARELGVKDCALEPARVVYHLGCHTSCDESLRPAAQAALSLLTSARVDVGVLGEAEVCCGGRALELGYEQAFLDQADRCNAALAHTGAELLVTGCAHCFHAFTVQYPRAGKTPPLKVMHASQYLAELAAAGRLRLGAGSLRVTYHDPCHLGRLGEPYIPWSGTPVPGHRRMFDPPKPWRRGTRGVYDPPRALLAALPGVELAEMKRVKEYAWCCGAGGGVPEYDPDFAAWTARERLEEAEATGAEALVTACPDCRRQLAAAAAQTGSPLRVVDLAELLVATGRASAATSAASATMSAASAATASAAPLGGLGEVWP